MRSTSPETRIRRTNPRIIMANYHALVQQVSQIKEKVEEKEGIPPVQQRLIHGGKQMYGTRSPQDCKLTYGNIGADLGPLPSLGPMTRRPPSTTSKPEIPSILYSPYVVVCRTEASC